MAGLMACAPVARATWSIAIADSHTGEVAVGTVTCLTNLDLLALVPVVVVGKGAAAVQAAGDMPGTRRQIIFNNLMLGTSPEDILTLLEGQAGHEQRQYGIADTQGRTITFSGSANFQFAGGVTGQLGSMVYAIQGNILTGSCVIEAIEQAIRNTDGDIPAKLMAGMQAAKLTGGDGRCSCNDANATACGCPPDDFVISGFIGGIIIARAGDLDDGSCDANGCADGNYYLRINAAFLNPGAPDPVDLIQTQFDTRRSQFVGRPDAVQSEVTFETAPQPPGCTVTPTMRVRLLDWRREPITVPIDIFSVMHAADSDQVSAIGPVVNEGGGVYSVTLTPGGGTGTDRFFVQVRDGIRPVILMPNPSISFPVDDMVDCNSNGVQDACDVDCDAACFDCDPEACGGSIDCNGNGIPDECEEDCNGNGIADECDIAAGTSADCNFNGVPDECDLTGGGLDHGCCEPAAGPGCADPAIEACVCAIDAYCCEVSWNEECAQEVLVLGCGICEAVGSPDCNLNGVPDECDIEGMTSPDCNGDGTPDECQLVDNDCDFDGVPDECQIAALIVEQPQSVSACPAATVGFSVVASSPTATFQWFKGATPLANGGDISGADTDTLTIENIAGTDAGGYSCEVSDGCLVARSMTAQLSLKQPVVITAHPATTLRQCVRRNAAFSVTVVGTEPVSYAWRRDGVLVGTSRVLNLPAITPSDAGQYVCTVSNECRTVQSNPGTLVVAGPLFISQPQDACVESGEMAQFAVEAEANSTIFWQWFKAGNPNALTDGGNISGSSTNTLTISPVSPADAGSYSALAFTLEPQPLAFCTNESNDAELTVDDCAAPGDFDGDGDLDEADFAIFLTAFGRSVGEPGYLAAADLDGDGTVTVVDFQMWLLLYRTFVGDPHASIPTGDPGDFDADGDVDLQDFARLQQCLPASPEFVFACLLKFDFDGDREVGLADYVEFEAEITGP